jgi:hypothetical protein
MMFPAHTTRGPVPGRMTSNWPAHCDPNAVMQWAAPLLDRAHRTGAIPDAGSRTWSTLDDFDPRKLAAIIRAALAWLHESTPDVIAQQLGDDLDLLDHCVSRRMKEISTDISGAANWSRLAAGPTVRELNRRRNTYHCPHCHAALQYEQTHCSECGRDTDTRPLSTDTGPGTGAATKDPATRRPLGHLGRPAA